MDNVTLQHFEGSLHPVETLDKVLLTIQRFRDAFGFWPAVGDYLEIKIENKLEIPGVEVDMGDCYLSIVERFLRFEGDEAILLYNSRIVGIDEDIE